MNGFLKKRAKGQFYTKANPFKHRAFKAWTDKAGLPKTVVLEPFAGANSLITHLKDMGLCHRFKSFDIKPAHVEVKKQDTLKKFPTGYKVCITNPPWLPVIQLPACLWISLSAIIKIFMLLLWKNA
ncbi:MAG: hypothetical protein OXJ52_01995 [Oligoflexia bacterium]|nr:hypothetical protein [Oligoflexia bacterium]